MKDTQHISIIKNLIKVFIIKVGDELYLEHTINEAHPVHTCPMG